MTSICGTYVKTFSEATHAMLQGASMNAPLPFHWVKVERVDSAVGHGILVCSGAGQEYRLPIHAGRGSEWAGPITVKDPLFGPVKFKLAPFKEG